MKIEIYTSIKCIKENKINEHIQRIFTDVVKEDEIKCNQDIYDYMLDTKSYNHMLKHNHFTMERIDLCYFNQYMKLLSNTLLLHFHHYDTRDVHYDKDIPKYTYTIYIIIRINQARMYAMNYIDHLCRSSSEPIIISMGSYNFKGILEQQIPFDICSIQHPTTIILIDECFYTMRNNEQSEQKQFYNIYNFYTKHSKDEWKRVYKHPLYPQLHIIVIGTQVYTKTFTYEWNTLLPNTKTYPNHISLYTWNDVIQNKGMLHCL